MSLDKIGIDLMNQLDKEMQVEVEAKAQAELKAKEEAEAARKRSEDAAKEAKAKADAEKRLSIEYANKGLATNIKNPIRSFKGVTYGIFNMTPSIRIIESDNDLMPEGSTWSNEITIRNILTRGFL